MIQHISILTSDGKSLLFREYGGTRIDHDLLAGFLSAFSGFFKEISQSEIKSTKTESNKFFYGLLGKLIIVIAADLQDDDEEVIKKLEEIMSKFNEKYGDKFENGQWNGERSIFKEFTEEIDKIVLEPIKVSIIGYGGVGKTTLMRLIIGEEVDLEYIPTITADIANYDNLDEKRRVVFWDFAGQLQFKSLWRGLLAGSRIALLVTDSSYENVTKSKKIITELIEKYFGDIMVICIANKQDLPNRLSPQFVEKILGYPTYGMIAINPQYRIKIHEILKDAIKTINEWDGLTSES
ncbi:MAG: GTP-binding protein [Promethearchaeota archaeon]